MKRQLYPFELREPLTGAAKQPSLKSLASLSMRLLTVENPMFPVL
jgi:hypothetical protein